jgi:hypothetical protein
MGADKLALLALCSLLIAILVSNVAWLARPSRLIRWLTPPLRVLYCLGLPLAVLWRGALVSEMGIPTTYGGAGGAEQVLYLLGLAPADELLRTLHGVALGLAGLLGLVVLWVWYVRLPTVTLDERPAVHGWDALREALLLQAHWAFYRGVVLTQVPARAPAAWIALLLIVIPWTLDPQRRHDVLAPRGYLVVQDWICALLTVLVVHATGRLWLLIVLHTLWLWVGGRTRARVSPPLSQPLPAAGPD